jgi:hypothetical protein
MSRDTAAHMTAEQKNYGISSDGLVALFQNRGYDALGYGNWRDYLNSELRSEINRLSDSEKLNLAVAMRQAGLSLRAVSAVVKWSHTNVQARVNEVLAAMAPEPKAVPPASKSPRSRKTYFSSVLDAGWAFRDAAEKLNELIYDDRFDAVREDIADQLESHLLVAQRAADAQLDNIRKATS